MHLGQRNQGERDIIIYTYRTTRANKNLGMDPLP